MNVIPLPRRRVFCLSMPRNGTASVARFLRDVGLSTSVAPKRKRLIAEADLAAIWVTNPERRLFAEETG